MAKSTQLITDSKALATGTFSATSTADAIAAAGPITDLSGLSTAILLHYEEALNMLTLLKAATDAGDPLRTQIQALIDVSV
jgi:hypothetical protein